MHPSAVWSALAAALTIGWMPPSWGQSGLSTLQEALAEVRGPAASVPLLTPPPPASNVGLPSLQMGAVCAPLQASLVRSLGASKAAWSISIVDPSGALILSLIHI